MRNETNITHTQAVSLRKKKSYFLHINKIHNHHLQKQKYNSNKLNTKKKKVFSQLLLLLLLDHWNVKENSTPVYQQFLLPSPSTFKRGNQNHRRTTHQNWFFENITGNLFDLPFIETSSSHRLINARHYL